MSDTGWSSNDMEPPNKRQKVDEAQNDDTEIEHDSSFDKDGGNEDPPSSPVAAEKCTDYVTAEEVERLREFQVLDECSNDGEQDSEEEEESDGKSEGVPEEEIEKMLDEDLPDDFKGAPKPKEKPYITRQKIVLEEKGVNQFEVLPLDWMMVRHYSGMPVYMHRGTRVCTLAKPYFLGKGNTRRHDIPISAIPCLAYRRALEEEAKQKEIDRQIEEQIKNGTWKQPTDQNKENVNNTVKNTTNVNIDNSTASTIIQDEANLQANTVNKHSEHQTSTGKEYSSKCPFRKKSEVTESRSNAVDDKDQISLKQAINDTTLAIIGGKENLKIKIEELKDANDFNQDKNVDLVNGIDNEDSSDKKIVQNSNFNEKDTIASQEKEGSTSHKIKVEIEINPSVKINQINEMDTSETEIVINEIDKRKIVKQNNEINPSDKVEERNEITNEVDGNDANNPQEEQLDRDSGGVSEIPLNRQPVVLPDGAIMRPPRVSTPGSSWQCEHITADQLTAYCRRLFKFNTLNIMHFKRWADRRKYTKARKTLQYPTLPEGTKLITIPAQEGANNVGGRTKRDWVMNMNGRSYLSVFHEYVRRALNKQPVYEFKQLENALQPYQATVYIGGMQYGVGTGSSKRAAKASAATASIHILIPEMRDQLMQPTHEPDFSFFDCVGIEDPRITEFCAATCEPSPHAILRTCLLRNIGAGDRHIHTEMKKLEHQKIELTMKVGKHSATVVCKNKKSAKQRASQAILQALHPHIRSWGSLLRLYGSRSVKSCKEKKLEEQQITLLQDAARRHQPNHKVLEKLRTEMHKLRARDEALVPIGTLLVKDDLPTHSGSNLNNVDL